MQLELQADQYALYKAIHITYTILEYKIIFELVRDFLSYSIHAP